MRLRIREEHRAMPAYEKPPAWRVDVYLKFLFFVLCSKVFDINETVEMLWKVWYNGVDE